MYVGEYSLKNTHLAFFYNYIVEMFNVGLNVSFADPEQDIS